MASEVALEVTVEVGEGAKSLKALKQEFRESQKELDGLTVGSDKYVASLKKLGRIKDEIGDLNQTIKAFNPEGKVQAVTTVVSGLASGFQAATGAAALFGGESKELEKSLLKVQAVMAFTEGIKGVIGLGDGFRNLVSILKSTAIGTEIVTAAQWLWNAAMDANPIGLLIIGVTALIGAVAALVVGQRTAAETQAHLNELEKEHLKIIDADVAAMEGKNKILSEANNFELKMLKAKGATDKELFDKENELIEKRRLQLQSIAGYRGELNADESKELLELTQRKAILLAEYTKKYIEESNKRIKENELKGVKELDDAKKIEEEKRQEEQESLSYLAELKKQDDEKELEAQKVLLDKIQADKEASREREYDAEVEAHQRKNKDKLAQVEIDQINNNLDLEHKKSNLMIQQQVELDNAELTENQITLIKVKYQKLSDRLDAEAKQKSLDNAQKLTQGLQALSDIVFITRSANLKKGSKEERELAEKQFKVNKALQLASATITGIKAVMAAYAAGLETGGPYAPLVGAAYAALAALESGAIIAKIASTQFDSGGGGSSSVADIGGGSVGGGGVPTINAPSSGNTQLNPNGTVVTNPPTQPTNTTVTVVETDIRITQDRVRMIENNAKI